MALMDVFGSTLRTRVLVCVAAIGETYASELARLSGSALLPVQRVIAGLENTGMVVTRKRGTVRLVSLNSRWFAFGELYALLLRMTELPEYARFSAVRRRPRSIGKPLP